MTSAAAESKGMKVNTLKTKVLCVTDSMSYVPVAFIEGSDGSRLTLEPGGTIKVLGFHFGDSASVGPHIKAIKKKIRRRLWTLYNLRKKGFTKSELVTVYKTSIRPLADYCDVVYHSLLTDEQDWDLERTQDKALRCIFGPRISGRRMRAMADITTLR